MLVALLLLDVVLDGLATGAHGVPGVQNLDHHVAAVDHLTQQYQVRCWVCCEKCCNKTFINICF